MLGLGTRSRAIATLLTIALIACGCSTAAATPSVGPVVPTQTPNPTAVPSTLSPSPSAAPALASASVGAPTEALIVLADGVNGGIGLWRLDGKRWTSVVEIPTASAVGGEPGGVLVANGPSIETRGAADLSTVSSSLVLSGQGVNPSSPVVALAASPAGTLVLATGADTKYSYFTATRDGATNQVKGAATMSFDGRVAWLDDAHVLMLSTDTKQQSKVAVVDIGTGTMKTFDGLIGCRDFALSGDGTVIAAATESGVYADSTSGWEANAQPAKVADAAASVVVWNLALDRAGKNLAVLAGTVGPSGSVSGVREVVYTKGPSGWIKTVDLAVPFTTSKGQTWLE